VPLCWDAELQTTGTLFSSDLLTHVGDPPALTHGDIMGPAMAAEKQFGFSGSTIRSLAKLRPRTLALVRAQHRPQVRAKLTIVRRRARARCRSGPPHFERPHCGLTAGEL
jgi:hypothetical protein